MYRIYEATAPTDLEHNGVFVEFTKEEKRAIRLTLKKLFRYCTENKIKHQVGWREMSLYNYVRGFWLFGSYKMTVTTYYQLQDRPNPFKYRYNNDVEIRKIQHEMLEIIGEERADLFFNKLIKEMTSRFHINLKATKRLKKQ